MEKGAEAQKLHELYQQVFTRRKVCFKLPVFSKVVSICGFSLKIIDDYLISLFWLKSLFYTYWMTGLSKQATTQELRCW